MSDTNPKRTSSDDIWKRDEIQSPCVKICIIHPEARLCTGCLRTIDEITQWSRLTHEARADVMEALPARAPQLQKRRGGRAARLTRGT
ncbi:DUF1289 domain-containing protein [Rhodobacteraceae bacterium N5(2021)]|uniref:DUF1289 domain-containing protein n=1 Tax=Gymnodinialimonas phycosphaerae TaxID=2841589 RepID=A0A975TW56_9RHOB|nr:DUF1289 domain-containing protein [Gymnodinialimonas phycosphaerae]MBY4892067.1 DUF1289 domain-containing protein [Gymnodinialimonas phycosphaerae]